VSAGLSCTDAADLWSCTCGRVGGPTRTARWWPTCSRPGLGRQGGRAGRHRPPAARRHQNAYLKSHSWDDYAKWHFGLTVGAKDGTKARYAFVYGDFCRIHRMGLIACSYRAAESRHKETELTADELLQYLDTKSERRRKR